MGPALRRVVAVLMVVLMAATEGCLSSSFALSSSELARLARTAPDQRWQGVRATQRMLHPDHPPAQATAVVVTGTQPVLLVPDLVWYRGRSWAVPSAWRLNAASRASLRVGGSTGGGGHGSSGGGSGGGSGSGSGSGGGALAAIAVVAVVATAGIVFVLAGTEGARYDGWLVVPPGESVYLDQPDGSVIEVPLWALTPALADQSVGATLYEGRDERFVRLGRAPIDRVGFAVQSGFALGFIPGSGGHRLGLGGRAFAGGFPVAALGLGATADVLSDLGGRLVALVGGEAQVMPLPWLGAYLGAGWASLDSDDARARGRGWYARAGVQLELPVTTRFAPSLRAGVSRLDVGAAAGALVMPELSLGLSVY